MFEEASGAIPERQEEPVSFSKYEGSSELENRMSELKEYVSYAENPHDYLDERHRIKLFNKLSYGLRKSGEGLARALYMQRVAKIRRKEAEAIAFLDDFSEYAQQNDIKATDKARENYVLKSKRVIDAAEAEACMDAWVEIFATTKQEFSMAIATLRALVFGPSQTNMMSNYSGE